jgi:hypothetical protein
MYVVLPSELKNMCEGETEDLSYSGPVESQAVYPLAALPV